MSNLPSGYQEPTSFEDVIAGYERQVETLRQQLAESEAAKDEAYAERNKLVAWLARQFPSGIKHTAIKGWDPEWHGCVYVDTPMGQLSWHYHDREAYLFDGLPTYQDEWDGHSTLQKYIRLQAATFLKGNEVDTLKVQLAVERERREKADELLRDIIDGVGCQPGYIRPMMIGRIQNFLSGYPRGESLSEELSGAQARIKELEEALKPFATFGFMDNGEFDHGRMYERIVDWFGPSDFERIRAAISTPAEQQE